MLILHHNTPIFPQSQTQEILREKCKQWDIGFNIVLKYLDGHGELFKGERATKALRTKLREKHRKLNDLEDRMVKAIIRSINRGVAQYRRDHNAMSLPKPRIQFDALEVQFQHEDFKLNTDCTKIKFRGIAEWIPMKIPYTGPITGLVLAKVVMTQQMVGVTLHCLKSVSQNGYIQLS